LHGNVRGRRNLNLGVNRSRRSVLENCPVTRSRNGRTSATASATAKATATACAAGETAGHSQCAAIAGKLSAPTAAPTTLARFRRSGNDRADAGAEGHQLSVNPYAAKVSRSSAFHLPEDLGVPGAEQKE
jgi:hypothetical protein